MNEGSYSNCYFQHLSISCFDLHSTKHLPTVVFLSLSSMLFSDSENLLYLHGFFSIFSINIIYRNSAKKFFLIWNLYQRYLSYLSGIFRDECKCRITISSSTFQPNYFRRLVVIILYIPDILGSSLKYSVNSSVQQAPVMHCYDPTMKEGL